MQRCKPSFHKKTVKVRSKPTTESSEDTLSVISFTTPDVLSNVNKTSLSSNFPAVLQQVTYQRIPSLRAQLRSLVSLIMINRPRCG